MAQANSTLVKRLIARICALTEQDIANLIAADEASFPTGASEECRTVLILLQDERDPEAEAKVLVSALNFLYAAGRYDDYIDALTDAWSCIPSSLIRQTLPALEGKCSAGTLILSIEELVRRVIAAEIARDLMSDYMDRSLTRPWRWSRVWGPDPCSGL